MNKARVLYIIFIFLLVEAIGWGLMHWSSRQSDFVNNHNYDKIRAMLIAEHGEEVVSKYISVPYLTYIPNPGFSKDGFIQHNKSGYRGEEVPLKKSDKYRILCLGGSTTYGTGVANPEHTYPAQLKKVLEDSGRFPQGVEVINAGVEAATSAEELNYYMFKFRYYQPDLVIVHSGGNDALISYSDSNFQLDYSHYRKSTFHLEPVSTPISWLLKSRFFSFLLIKYIYAPQIITKQNMFTLEGEKSSRYAHWTDEELLTDEEQKSRFYSFYQNHSLLIRNILEDETDVINLTFGFDTLYMEKREMDYAIKAVIHNNDLIHQVGELYSVTVIPYSYSHIDSAYWLDDCHLDEDGEKQKAQLIASFVIDM